MDTCSICFDNFDGCKAITPKCGHTFHNECLSHWLLENDSCPMCRFPIGVTKVDPISEYLEEMDDYIQVSFDENVADKIIYDNLLQEMFEFMKILINTVDEEDEGHEEYWIEEDGFKLCQFRCQYRQERVDVFAIYKNNHIEFDLQRTYLKTNNRKILNKINKNENWKIKNKRSRNHIRMSKTNKKFRIK